MVSIEIVGSLEVPASSPSAAIEDVHPKHGDFTKHTAPRCLQPSRNRDCRAPNGPKKSVAAYHWQILMAAGNQALITNPDYNTGTDKPAVSPDRTKATAKWLTASVTDDIATVIAAGFDKAERNVPKRIARTSQPWNSVSLLGADSGVR